MAATQRDARTGNASRSEKSRAIHTTLDQAAALINSVHAKVLAEVIEAQAWKIHRDIDGYSALREWLVVKFDFHSRTATDIAAIARTARKFTTLAAAAIAGAARIDTVAAATRRLEQVTALRKYAKTPFPEPVASPFDPEVACATPEALIAQWCTHASVKAIHAHLDELQAALDSGEAVVDGLAEQSLQRLDLVEIGNGMWDLRATLDSTTGAMLDKLLTTAVPPPRQEETDADGLLPAAANRRAEALHHMLTVYGTDPAAATRHGHTTQLHLSVDIETLQGRDTGRVPLLEGNPISLAKARLLACEGQVIPSVFNYATGEAVELGRAERLPTTALRRKLEAEQPGGCAWQGCAAPLAWTEAHHLTHWADGGPTVAENLILLCRFHHGRLHTTGWTVTKTGPGQALIVHHDHCRTEGPATTSNSGSSGGSRAGSPATGGQAEGQPAGDRAETEFACGCTDYRTDADLDTELAEHLTDNVFPTGLYPDEWGRALRAELDGWAEAINADRDLAATRAARAQARSRSRSRFTEEANAAHRIGMAVQTGHTGHASQANPPDLASRRAGAPTTNHTASTRSPATTPPPDGPPAEPEHRSDHRAPRTPALAAVSMAPPPIKGEGDSADDWIPF